MIYKDIDLYQGMLQANTKKPPEWAVVVLMKSDLSVLRDRCQF